MVVLALAFSSASYSTDDVCECSASSTCCPTQGGGYSCCPSGSAVCCADGKSCCPSSFPVCDLDKHQCLGYDESRKLVFGNLMLGLKNVTISK